MIDHLIAQCLAEEPLALELIGQRYLTKTEINQATSLLKKYNSGEPEYSNALYLLGLIKFKKKQYSQAINYVESAIAMGNSWAMNLRAYMHDKGLGGTRDASSAIQLYEQSSALGNSGAINGLAYMHYENKDYNNAILFYQKAIKMENSLAMINQAQMYELGEGEEINYPKAIELYDKAIALGNGLAMGRRARMHKEGIGGPQNILESCRLFYQAYDKTRHQEYLEELKDLPQERLDTQVYLIFAYLHNNYLKPDAQKIFLANFINLAPLLVKEMILLLNGLAPQPHLIQNLRSLLLLEADAVTYLNIWPYAQFKLHLFDGNRQKAYQLFVECPQIIHEFLASDWNELGQQVVADSLADSIPESKLIYLRKSCNFFYNASRTNGDNEFYHALYLSQLKEKETLEVSLNTTLINRNDEVFSASEPQVPPFKEPEIIPLNYTKEIETLSRYLKSNQSKSNLSDQQLVYFLIRRLTYNFPLEASLHLSFIRKQLSKADLLYHTLKNLLPADSSALKPLLTDEACKLLLETTNCGQQVYEALQNNALSANNLKFLAKAQDKVYTFLKTSGKDKVEKEAVNALFKQSENNDTVKTKSYRHNARHTLFRPFMEKRNPLNQLPQQKKW